MKRILLPMLVAGFLPLTASAESALEGSWRIDWPLAFPDLLDKFEVGDGYYDCQTCAPPIRVKADGKDHPVKGYKGFDSISVQVKNDYQVRIQKKKAGKAFESLIMSVSSDGKLLRYNSYSGSNQSIVEGSERTRLGEPIKGEHAVSGVWVAQGMEQSAADSTFHYRIDNGQLSVTMDNGESYTAPLDGSFVPYSGSQEIDRVSVRQLAERVLNIQLYKGETFVQAMQVSATEDGQALSIHFVMPDMAMTGNLIARKITLATKG